MPPCVYPPAEIVIRASDFRRTNLPATTYEHGYAIMHQPSTTRRVPVSQATNRQPRPIFSTLLQGPCLLGVLVHVSRPCRQQVPTCGVESN
jgi:hypothetical protein